jgi:arylsulfatase A-like enzyme
LTTLFAVEPRTGLSGGAEFVRAPGARAIAGALVWCALAAGLLEGGLWSVLGHLPLREWPVLMGVAALSFPVAVLPPLAITLAVLSRLVKGNGGLRSPVTCATGSFVFFALALPIAMNWNARHAGFTLSASYLGPYAVIAAACLLVAGAAAVVAAAVAPHLSDRGPRRARRVIKVGLAGILLGWGAQAAVTELRARAPQGTSARSDQRDVLLVTIDTLRRDRLGTYGYAKRTDPEIARAFADGLIFRDAVSLVPLTRPSHASILTGRHPLELGLRWNDRPVPDDVPTLAQVLHARGYRTAAFVSGFPLEARHSHLDRGFEVYSDDFNPFGRIHPATEHLTLPNLARIAGIFEITQRTAAAVTDTALGWLASAPHEPLFLFVHYYDPHAVYRPPSRFARDMGLSPDGPSTSRWIEARIRSGDRHVDAREEQDMNALYDGEVRFVDAQLGRLFEALRDRGSWDRTLVMLLADHGEVLFERLASDGDAFDHQNFPDEEGIRIPFLLRGPGVPAGTRGGFAVATCDVLPTLLGRLGIPVPPGVTGRDLLATDESSLADRPLVSVNSPPGPSYADRVTARLGGVRYTRDLNSGREWVTGIEGEPFDRESIDPESAVANRLRAAALSIDLSSKRGTLGPDEEAALRALGYVQ